MCRHLVISRMRTPYGTQDRLRVRNFLISNPFENINTSRSPCTQRRPASPVEYLATPMFCTCCGRGRKICGELRGALFDGMQLPVVAKMTMREYTYEVLKENILRSRPEGLSIERRRCKSSGALWRLRSLRGFPRVLDIPPHLRPPAIDREFKTIDF